MRVTVFLLMWEATLFAFYYCPQKTGYEKCDHSFMKTRAGGR